MSRRTTTGSNGEPPLEPDGDRNGDRNGERNGDRNSDRTEDDTAGEAAAGLLFDAMTALESLHRGIEESGALISAAARVAAEAPPNDTVAGIRAVRHVSFLLLCAARRTESLENEADSLVMPLLERWTVVEQR